MTEYRPYDENLDYVHVRQDGRILFEGDEIGYVGKTEGLAKEMGAWRAEIGSVADPEAWPQYRVAYAPTRKAAVGDLLDNLVVPE